MISRALRGKCPLSFYNQGKERRDPEKPTRQNRHPSCAPVLPLSCALCLPPLTTTQRQGLEKLGKGNQAPGPLLTPRARAAQITLHA